MNAHAARYLHIANGTSVTTTLQAAGVPGSFSIWADPLHEGPVPAGLSDTELLDVRRRFLSAGADPDGGAATDPMIDMCRWREVIARHGSFDELVLWFEHDLFDQLNLIQLLTWIRGHLPAAKPVALVCIGSYPGRPDFTGLGELSAAELAPLLEVREPLTDPQFDLARRAWHAFRAPTPEAIDALRREPSMALPYLGAALTRLLQEYPWTSDGLSRTERRLLELASNGPIPLAEAFPRIGQGDRFFTITDRSLLATAKALGDASPSLLAIAPAAPTDDPLEATIEVTEAGWAVVTGRQDRIGSCGIDRWLGGVHLEGRHGVWRWDDDAQRVVRG